MALTRFLVRRILSGIVVLWVVGTLAFFLFFARNPELVARQLAGRAATATIIQEVTRNLGLSQPILTQYWHFLDRTVHGNLGLSYYNGGVTVASIVGRDLPRTASVLFGGVVLWLIVGLAVGILSATRARRLFDRFATVGVLVGLSMPTFVLGEVLLLAIYLPLNQNGYHFINTGYVGLSSGVGPWLGTMILPWVTLTPVVSQLGIDIGSLLGGVVVVEQVFGIGGLGQDAVGAISNGDLPTILAFVLLAALFVVVANIIVDLVYAVLDPRVRISCSPERPPRRP